MRQTGKNKGKDAKNLDEEIKKRDRTFVLFYASGCPFCQKFRPLFEKYAESNPNECMSVEIDEKPELFDEYSVEYYPAVLCFKKGKLHSRIDAESGVGLTKKQLDKLTGS